MKKLKTYKFIFLLLPFLFTLLANRVAAQVDSVAAEELVKLRYFNDNNSVQYLVLEDLLKTGRKKEPLKNKVFQLYLDSNTPENFIAKVTTDENGLAKSFLPPSLKATWEANTLHKFIALAAGKEETVAELEITKVKIQMDTTSEGGTRSITVHVNKYENSKWVPASEVEMKIGIRRMASSILSAGDEETYTTDSSGTATVQFTKDSLPGDDKGNIVLVAKVEDNDLYGNLLIEKTVLWGVPEKVDNTFFNQRALWSARPNPPIWLLIIANSILIGVWGTIIYLIMQIVKIKKIGRENDPNPST